MILGTVTDRIARCGLCGTEAMEKSDDEAEFELRRHLRMLHGRSLVSREDRKQTRLARVVREFHGIYWKNEL